MRRLLLGWVLVLTTAGFAETRIYTLGQGAGSEIFTVLKNGTRVVVKEHHASPVIAVRLYVQTGGLYEGKDLGKGLSHFMEHIVHGGTTPKRTEDQSRTILQKLGNNTNAYTSLAHTCYYINTTPNHLGEALGLLSDWAGHCAFVPKEFHREKGVVTREIEKGQSEPRRVIWNLYHEQLYAGHPAATPVIGTPEGVASVTREDCLNYFRRKYVPANFVVAVVGDVKASDALAAVKQTFGQLPRGAVPSHLLPAPPVITSPRRLIRRSPLPEAQLWISFPTIPLDSPDLYALDVLSYILTTGRASRLYRRLVREEKLVLKVGSFSLTPAWGRGSLTVTARIDPAKRRTALAGVMTELKKFKTQKVTADELARAKRQKKMGFLTSRQTAESLAGNLATDWLSTGDPLFSDRYLTGIETVTAEEVQRVARRYIQSETLCVTLLTPPVKDAQKVKPPKATGPTRVRRIVFPNGLRVILAVNRSTPLVAMQFYALGGVLADSEKTAGLSDSMARMCLRGTKTRTAEKINRLIDSLGAGLSAGGGYNTVFFKCSGLASDLDKLLPLFAEVIGEPVFPAVEWERLKPRRLAAIARLDESWSSESSVFFRRHFFTGPCRFTPAGVKAAVETFTSADLRKRHQTLITGKNAVLTIVGDIDIARMEKQIIEHFASLPSGKKFSPRKEKPSAKKEKILRKKTKKTVAAIYMGFPGMKIDNIADRDAMAVLDTLISGYHFPDGWLHEQLRGKGLVYVVHAFNVSGLEPGFFGIMAACQPEKADAVINIIRKNLNRACATTFTDAELAKARGVIATSEMLSRQTNAQLAQTYALDELYGLGYDHWRSLEKRLATVNADRVRTAAQKYLKSGPTLITVCSPR